MREACRLSASPQLRNVGTIGGNLLQATRCWYWRLKFPCRLHGGDVCHARDGEHREHAILANDFCASAHPSDPAAALLALGATIRTDRRELPLVELYRVPTENDRDDDDAREGRAHPRARRPAPGRVDLPQGDGPAGAGRSRSSVSPPRASARRRGRPRRRRADPVAARIAGRGDARCRNGVQEQIAEALVARARAAVAA